MGADARAVEVVGDAKIVGGRKPVGRWVVQTSGDAKEIGGFVNTAKAERELKGAGLVGHAGVVDSMRGVRAAEGERAVVDMDVATVVVLERLTQLLHLSCPHDQHLQEYPLRPAPIAQ